ncbi:MFS transporter [Streptomyces violarus]|uniref:MFS family permease n=1 Tax=Streptomyces violarus TaxID=67380 RepID=A0A7W5EZZ3_9ACTN|nr:MULTISPECIES: MFS transporter [Streptomyces]MBB3074869.1 MFS family permease [Streptomyces violarus]WRT97518.1 MFS transporter [Streptomyces sp. CGMCC 4.1772]GHD01160.1 MFS transporter [Streptomyces violarus]
MEHPTPRTAAPAPLATPASPPSDGVPAPIPSTPPADGAAKGERLTRLGPLVFLANFGWMLPVAVSGTLIPALLTEIDPAQKVTLYGTLTSIGAAVSLIANIFFGALSDRTRSRFGSRSPWILAGGLIAAVTLVTLSVATTFWAVLLGWTVFQLGLNAFLSSLVAVTPDRVAPERRGTISTVTAFGVLLAQSLGSVVGAAFLSEARTGLRVAPWLLAFAAVAFVVLAPDRPNIGVARAPLSARTLLRTFAVPMDRDFLCALFGRFLLLLAYLLVLLYQLFILTDYLHLSEGRAASLIATIGIIGAVTSGGAAAVSGPLSDKLGRRKILVVLSSVLIALAAVVPAVFPSVAGLLVFMAVGGVAYGIYNAVDAALMTEVLPSDDDHGKDMGVLNVANTGSQVLAPVVASLILGAGLGYRGLFVTSSVLALASCLFILPINRVR